MKIKVAVVSLFLLFSTVACQSSGIKSGNADIKTTKDSLSYAIGLELGQNLKRQKVDVKLDLLLNALSSGYNDTSWALSREQTRKIIVNFQTSQYLAKQAEKRKEGEINLKNGKEFLAKNKNNKGVHITKSGLQYKILKKGKGASPKDNAKVTVNYTGSLLNGNVFDSSKKRGKPAVFLIGRVIKGWTEALKLMKTGSKWKVWIPANLAYGSNGGGGKIGPDETLIFEIELLKFENQKPNKNNGRKQSHRTLKPLKK